MLQSSFLKRNKNQLGFGSCLRTLFNQWLWVIWLDHNESSARHFYCVKIYLFSHSIQWANKHGHQHSCTVEKKKGSLYLLLLCHLSFSITKLFAWKMALDVHENCKSQFYDFVSLTPCKRQPNANWEPFEMVCNATTTVSTIFIHAVERANDIHCGNNHMF